MTTTIIFDLGGVFVSDAPIYYENHLCDFKEVLEYAGVSREDAAALWKKHWPDMKYGKERIAVFWDEFKDLLKDGVELDEVIRRYQDRIIIDKDVLKYAYELKEKYRLIALANESRDGIDLKIEKFNLNALFEKIYCSAYLRMAKPNQDIYEHVIEDADIDLDDTIFVDNQMENIEAAESLGLMSIFYTGLDRLKEDMGKIMKGR